MCVFLYSPVRWRRALPKDKPIRGFKMLVMSDRGTLRSPIAGKVWRRLRMSIRPGDVVGRPTLDGAAFTPGIYAYTGRQHLMSQVWWKQVVVEIEGWGETVRCAETRSTPSGFMCSKARVVRLWYYDHPYGTEQARMDALRERYPELEVIAVNRRERLGRKKQAP